VRGSAISPLTMGHNPSLLWVCLEELPREETAKRFLLLGALGVAVEVQHQRRGSIRVVASRDVERVATLPAARQLTDTARRPTVPSPGRLGLSASSLRR